MAITVGKYHLFERERRGRSYFEVRGKRVQKACGHGCDDKRSAVAYLKPPHDSKRPWIGKCLNALDDTLPYVTV